MMLSRLLLPLPFCAKAESGSGDTISCDVVVIGAGPGGYVAAIRAAQLGLSVVLVEKSATLGGTCLNVGCIPSKALLESSDRWVEANQHLASHGVQSKGFSLDLAAMMARKDSVVTALTKGVAGLMRKNRITVQRGQASIEDAQRVRVVGNDGERVVNPARAVIIASGSVPGMPPGLDLSVDDDSGPIVTSTGALKFSDVPKRLAVIGAGVIGMEMGSVWRRLGAEVTVVEYADTILPSVDAEASKLLHRLCKRQGWQFLLAHKVVAAEVGKGSRSATLTVEPVSGGQPENLEFDRVLVSVGRRPCTDGLNLDAVGIATDKRGFVTVDPATGQTNVPGIYAIGDVTGGLMLAHEASDEGVMVAEIIAGHHGAVNRNVIPAVVYTMPEIATVGASQAQLDEQGVDYKSGRVPMAANARAIAHGSTDGFVKLFSHRADDRLLGAVVMAPFAGSLIQEVALAMEFGGSAEDIARTCHGHPTLVESVREAAHVAAFGQAINA